MANEFLKPILGEELLAQVDEKLNGAQGITLANIADGTHIPKAKFDEVNGKVNGLNAQIAQLTAQLEEANKSNGDVTALTAQIAQLKNDLDSKDAAMAKAELTYKVRDQLRGMSVRDADIVMPLLKLENAKVGKDGKVEGLAEQVEELKKNYGYLFEPEKPNNFGFGNNGAKDSGTQKNAAMNAAIRAMSGR